MSCLIYFSRLLIDLGQTVLNLDSHEVLPELFVQ